MKLREGITFDNSKNMVIAFWKEIEPPIVDMTLLGEENIFNEIEKCWKGCGNAVLDFSVCWLFCYGNSGGRYGKFEAEIPALWNRLFDIPYNIFLNFQTAMDGGIIPTRSDDRYMHKRREIFRDKMNDFTFIDRDIRDFLLMSILYGR